MCPTDTYREIAGQGYPGAYQNVVRRITRYLKEQQEVLGEPLPDTSPGISSAAAQAAGILVKRPERTALKKRDEHLLRG
jgi:hypothetical protein